MDALSAAASVLQLTSTCLAVAKSLHSLREKFKNASLTISSICAETTVLSTSLSQLQALLLRDSQAAGTQFQSRPELAATFDTALTGCMVVYSCLEDEVKKLGATAGTDYAWKTRARAVWKDATMKEYLQQIRGQQASLAVLLQLIQLESLSEIQTTLRTNGAMLENIFNKTKSLRSSHPDVRFPKSIFEAEDPEAIGSDDVYSAVSTTEFEFDDLIVTSRVYRRVMETTWRNRSVQQVLKIEVQGDIPILAAKDDFDSNSDFDEFFDAKQDQGNDEEIESLTAPASTEGALSRRKLIVNHDAEPESTLSPLSGISSSDHDTQNSTQVTLKLPSTLSPRFSYSDTRSEANSLMWQQRWQAEWNVTTQQLESLSQASVEWIVIWYEIAGVEQRYTRALQTLRDVGDKINLGAQWPLGNLGQLLWFIRDCHETYISQPLQLQLKEGWRAYGHPALFRFWVVSAKRMYGSFYMDYAAAKWSLESLTKDGHRVIFRTESDPSFSQDFTWQDLLLEPLNQISRYVDLLGRLIAVAEPAGIGKLYPEYMRDLLAAHGVVQDVKSLCERSQTSSWKPTIKRLEYQEADTQVLSRRSLQLVDPLAKLLYQSIFQSSQLSISGGEWMATTFRLYDGCLAWGYTEALDASPRLSDNLQSIPVDHLSFARAQTLECASGLIYQFKLYLQLSQQIETVLVRTDSFEKREEFIKALRSAGCTAAWLMSTESWLSSPLHSRGVTVSSSLRLT